MSQAHFDQIDTILDGLGDDATAAEVYEALWPYEQEDQIAVIQSRAAAGGGGGGSQPGAPVVHGPFAFAYNTPGLTTGVEFFTPTIGDVLMGFCFCVLTAWNGSDPAKGDFGPFVNETTGFFSLTEVNAGGANMKTGAAGLLFDTIRVTSAGIGEFGYLCQITTADPWKVVVSQNGQINGSAPSGVTQGSTILYVVTATPVAFS